jgi:hypothetical protein
VRFLDPPKSYYRMLADSLELVRHTADGLEPLGILVDADHDGHLFFEVIERLHVQTFGSGTVQALYQAGDGSCRSPGTAVTRPLFSRWRLGADLDGSRQRDSRTRLRQGRPTEEHFDYANLARYLAAHRALAVENDVQQRAVYGAKSGLNRSTLPVKAGRRSTSWDSLAQSFRMPQAVCSSLFHLRRDANIRRRGRKRELRFTVRVCLWVAPLPACP